MIIEFRGVKFSHAGVAEGSLLDIDNWCVDTGERVFVHGPSGAGKSTLLNLMSGLLTCSEGAVSILGERLDRMNSRQRDRFRANNLGYVFQQFNLVPYLSAVENIELAKSFATRAKRKAARGGAEGLLASLNVVPDDWGKPTSQLSMGQQQRVAIARALVNSPAILIADEPTSSLDQENRDNFLSVLMSIIEAHNMTLIFVSHDMSLAKYFSRAQALSDFSRVA